METDRHTKKLKLNDLGTTSGKQNPKLSSVSGQGHHITFTVGGMLLLLLILAYFQNLLSHCVYYTAGYDPPGYISHPVQPFRPAP